MINGGLARSYNFHLLVQDRSNSCKTASFIEAKIGSCYVWSILHHIYDVLFGLRLVHKNRLTKQGWCSRPLHKECELLPSGLLIVILLNPLTGSNVIHERVHFLCIWCGSVELFVDVDCSFCNVMAKTLITLKLRHGKHAFTCIMQCVRMNLFNSSWSRHNYVHKRDLC